MIQRYNLSNLYNDYRNFARRWWHLRNSEYRNARVLIRNALASMRCIREMQKGI